MDRIEDGIDRMMAIKTDWKPTVVLLYCICSSAFYAAWSLRLSFQRSLVWRRCLPLLGEHQRERFGVSTAPEGRPESQDGF